MKKRFISIIIATTMLVCATLPVFAKGTLTATVGRGTKNSPFLISTSEELLKYAMRICDGINADNKYYKLTNDIVSTFSQPIGNEDHPFSGYFDGAGYSISINLSFFDNFSGLFGVISDGSTVCNLTISGNIDSSGTFGGSICGKNDGAIINCTNNATVTGDTTGGLCGYNAKGKIINCINNAPLSGKSGVGGICGRNDSIIQNCVNNGTVSLTGSLSGINMAGGICANNFANATIENCYSTGSVNGNGMIGGVCGNNFSVVNNCYYKDDTGSDKYSISDMLMRAESGTDGALIDLLNSYTSGSGSYPTDWFIWVKEEGGYPHFTSDDSFNISTDTDNNEKCEKCGFVHSDGLLSIIFCRLVLVIETTANYICTVFQILF